MQHHLHSIGSQKYKKHFYLCLQIYLPMENNIITETIKSLEKNHFEVFFVENREEAKWLFFETIFPRLKPTTVSWGDSETMKSTGILQEIEKRPDCVLIKTFGENYTTLHKTYWRRQALQADLFLAGCNALTRRIVLPASRSAQNTWLSLSARTKSSIISKKGWNGSVRSPLP